MVPFNIQTHYCIADLKKRIAVLFTDLVSDLELVPWHISTLECDNYSVSVRLFWEIISVIYCKVIKEIWKLICVLHATKTMFAKDNLTKENNQ